MISKNKKIRKGKEDKHRKREDKKLRNTCGTYTVILSRRKEGIGKRRTEMRKKLIRRAKGRK